MTSMRSQSAGGMRVAVVRGREEHDLREIERHVEVVILEGVVLLGIEHLEERRRGIAAHVDADLVDLVEHEHGVLRADLLQAPG